MARGPFLMRDLRRFATASVWIRFTSIDRIGTGFALRYARRYDEAIQEFQKALASIR